MTKIRNEVPLGQSYVGSWLLLVCPVASFTVKILLIVVLNKNSQSVVNGCVSCDIARKNFDQHPSRKALARVCRCSEIVTQDEVHETSSHN